MPTHRPDRGKSVRQTVVALTFANIVYGACQWLILVILVQCCHELEVGRFARGLAIAGPIMMCTSLQLRTLLATDTAHEYRWIDYVLARTMMLWIALTCVIGVCMVAGYAALDTQVVVFVSLVKAIESGSNLIYGYFQNAGRTYYVATSMVLKGLATVVGAWLGCCLTHGARGAAAGMLLFNLLVYVSFDLITFMRIRHDARPVESPRDSPKHSRWSIGPALRLMRQGIAPGAIVGLNSLNMNIPRYFIDSLLGTVPLGIFTSLASLMRVSSYVELALVQSTQTQMSRQWGAGRIDSYRRLLRRVLIAALAVGLGLAVLSWLFGHWLLTVTYSPVYADYASTLVILMFAGAIGNVAGVLKGATDASRRYAVQIPIFTCSVLVAVAGALVLIPRMGMQGAAWSVVLTKLSLVLGYLVVIAVERAPALARTATRMPDPVT